MTVFGYILGFLRFVFGAAALCGAIWFGLPILGIDTLAAAETRVGLIGLTLLVLVAGAVLRWRMRRRSARLLESSLIDTTVGDGDVLAERMQDAVARLKQAGGATALYDLPWYVIIGPPGAGKTTALVHSGLEFPGTDPRSVAGYGGTRNCDIWFARDAILLDTAGRYTTQDSDAVADRSSWAAFLTQVKSARRDQPINGILLAFSCADLMTASTEELRVHAETLRARLEEVHETLRTHVPVYVMFTKADIIAGFREYFSSFDERRRKGVWGVTFQTRSRKDDTARSVPDEYAQLLTRLSDEVSDRMAEERDSATRIAVLGFPGQMAMLEPKITKFLSGVFKDAAQIKAILRGFYFTSGTQEGTPIDQVLGSFAASGAGGLQVGFMSGRGRSFFLHDLLKKVIFAERDWVGYDRRRIVRGIVLRGLGKTAIAAVCLGAAAAFGYSFWSNASLVRAADAQAHAYQQRAAALVGSRYIENAATRGLLPALASVRAIPTGYADPRPQTVVQHLGLSRREMLRGAAVEAYSKSLERLLRPRMMLLVERHLARALLEQDLPEAYRALKVYILLAKEQSGRDDDLAIQSFFARAWTQEYQVSGSDADYRAINAHVSAMLALDDRVSPPIKPNKALVDRAREDLKALPLAEQVMGVVASDAAVLPYWRLVDALPAPERLRVTDGRSVETLVIPGLYTYEGYWRNFQNALSRAQQIVDTEAWVLARSPAVAPERATLLQDVHALYVRQFTAEWQALLGMIAGDSEFAALAPLSHVLGRETRMMRIWDTGTDNITNADASTSMGTGRAIEQDEPTLAEVKGIWPALSESTLRQRAEDVARAFSPWFGLAQGREGGRPIDAVIRDLETLSDAPAMLTQVAPRLAAMPPLVARMAGHAALMSAEVALQRDVTAPCGAQIAGYYPFGGPLTDPLPLRAFTAFFGGGGTFDAFWQTYAGQSGIELPLSPKAQADFDAIRALQRQFFATGAVAPELTLRVHLKAVSKGIATLDLDLGRGKQRLVAGGADMIVNWPEDFLSMEWTVNAERADAEILRIGGGPWAVVNLTETAENVQTDATGLDATLRVGAHAFRVALEADGAGEMAFVHPALKSFECPDQLK